jgi:peptidoglycan-associated lipoprotein
MTQMSATFRRFALVMMIAALAVGSACSSKKSKEDEGAVPNAPSADENLAGDSDSGKAMGLQTVHFAYDSFNLDSEGKSALKGNAEILKGHGNVKIQIEGHCDQSGGIQYNIALGEKRANAVKKFLADLGVSGDRVTTISFGKERPVDTGTSPEAMAKNRRANFVITSK